MSKQEPIEIWPEAPVVREDRVLCRAIIERPGAERFALDYHFPAEYQWAVSDRADGYACALLLEAMHAGRPLRVHGTVAPTLLANLEEFQSAWENMKGDCFTRIPIDADREVEDQPGARRGALAMFSGGADATYTLWRHTRGDAGRQKRTIAAAAFVHGFDIPLAATEGFAVACRRAEAITSEAGVPLIRVATNFRALPLNWEYTHGAALAAIHLLLQRGFDRGLIASGNTYHRLKFPWGSSPLTDWMLGSATCPIVHDAGAVDRWRKIKALATWPTARKNLRICYQTEAGNNCGVCYKCLRSILLFRAVGAGLPECFARDVDDRFIRTWARRGMTFDADKSLSEILDAARLHGTEGSWTVALRAALREHLRHRNQSWIKRLRTKVAVRTRLRRLLSGGAHRAEPSGAAPSARSTR